MEKNVEAFIFDLDGVLTDTVDLHFYSWKKLCDELGYELELEKNKYLKGVSRKHSMSLILEWADMKLSVGDMEMLMDKKNKWYLEEVEKLSPGDQLPGALQFIEELEEKNVDFALASGSQNARKILDQIGLSSHFKIIFDGNDIQNGKPDPEIFLITAAALNAQPSNVVVFEDSVAGLTSALKGGFMTVGFGADPELSQMAHFTLEDWKGVSYELINKAMKEVQSGQSK